MRPAEKTEISYLLWLASGYNWGGAARFHKQRWNLISSQAQRPWCCSHRWLI